MRKRRGFLGCWFVFLLILLLHGCAYMHIQRPLDMNYEETSLGTKIGKSHTYSVLWLVSWGDGGTKAAAEDGGITVIKHADIEVYVILFGIYARVSTVVYGD
jgi:hypothetical protein